MGSNLDAVLTTLKSVLQQEHQAGRINSLIDVADSQRRRETINRSWQTIQEELASIAQQIRVLPNLPPQAQILWAQAVLALRNLAFLEVDTTGLDEQDEIVRFTLIDSNFNTIDDVFIKPTALRLSAGVSRINGIPPEQLEREGIPLAEAWGHIHVALRGRYIISYSQKWDVQQLEKAAMRHQLEPVLVIGDDLQRHASLYYQREHNLSLASICERIGQPLPEYPNQTSLDRAKGQIHVLAAMADAITDVRPTTILTLANTDLDNDELGDLEDHPF